MLPSGSTLQIDSLTRIRICCTLNPHEYKWPSICLLPQVGNSLLISWMMLPSSASDIVVATSVVGMTPCQKLYIQEGTAR